MADLTPNEGLNRLGQLIYNEHKSTLVLYLITNTAGSLNAQSVFADLTFPTPGAGGGSASFAFATGADWTITDGVLTYPGTIIFENTGTANWTGDVTGVALCDVDSGRGSAILHQHDFSFGASTMTPSDKIRIDLLTDLA